MGCQDSESQISHILSHIFLYMGVYIGESLATAFETRMGTVREKKDV